MTEVFSVAVGFIGVLVIVAVAAIGGAVGVILFLRANKNKAAAINQVVTDASKVPGK
jgi:hypothetical protein